MKLLVIASMIIACNGFSHSCGAFVGSRSTTYSRHLFNRGGPSVIFKRKLQLPVALNPLEGDVQTFDDVSNWAKKGVVSSGLNYKALGNQVEDFPSAGAVRAGEIGGGWLCCGGLRWEGRYFELICFPRRVKLFSVPQFESRTPLTQ